MPDLWTVVGKLIQKIYAVSVAGDYMGDWEDIDQVWVSASFRDEEEAKGYLAEIQALAVICVECHHDLIEDQTSFEIEHRNGAFDAARFALKTFDKEAPLLEHPDENGGDFFYRFTIYQNPLKGF